MNTQSAIEAKRPDLLTAALDYAARGWKVFPCVPADKPPLTGNGQNAATTDPEKIRAWWAKWPDANIGWNLAASGMVAIDADTYKPECEWDAVQAAHNVPATLTQRSARGGTHFVFKAEPDARYRGDLGKAIDTRHKNYILLAPSVFAGGSYEWANDAPIAPAPAWLKRPERTLAETVGNAQGASGRTLAEAEDALKFVSADCGYSDWLAILQGLHNEFGDDAIPLAEEWSATAPHRYQEGLVETKFASFTAGEGVTIKTVFDRARKGGADLGQLRHKHNDPTKLFKSEGGEDRTDAPTVPARPRLSVVSFSEAVDTAFIDSAEPLVDGWLDVGASSVIYGASNVGKTFVVLDMACSIALGVPWAGRDTKKSGVLYVAAEGGGGIRKRFAALQRKFDVMPANFNLASGDLTLCDRVEDTDAIIDAANAIPGGCGLIVIDTLAQTMGRDENSTADMNLFVRRINQIRAATGAHTLIVHHTGKDESKGGRGSVALKCAVDTELEISKDVIRTKKQRDRERAPDLSFSWEVVHLGTDEKGRPITSSVVHVGATQLFQQEPAPVVPEELTEGDRAALTALQDLVDTSGRVAVKSAAVIAHIQAREPGVTYDAALAKLKRLKKQNLVQQPVRGCWSVAAGVQSVAGYGADPETAENARKIGQNVLSLLDFSKRQNTGTEAQKNTTGQGTGHDIFG